jgi:hydroxyacylglutathione hydrolase
VDVRTITHGRYRTNTYLISDGQSPDALMLDPTENPDGLAAFAAGAGLSVVAIAATHPHFDHVGGVAGLRAKLGVPFLIGRDAVDALHNEAARAKAAGHAIPAPPAPDCLLVEGDSLKIGGLTFTVLATPGHSQGDISLYEPRQKAVFTGDTLHQGEVGRYNSGCNEALLLASIRAKLMMLPDDVWVFSGHGGATTIGRERETNAALLGAPRRTSAS